MAVKDDTNVLSIDDRIAGDDHSLNQSVVRRTHVHSRGKRGDRLDDFSSYHNHSFNVILPRKLSEHTDNDLRLMLVSLKNVRCASSVHILRIERELKKRGSKLRILS
jgi:hypothetical protein